MKFMQNHACGGTDGASGMPGMLLIAKRDAIQVNGALGDACDRPGK